MEDIGHVSQPSVEYLLRIKGDIANLSTNLRCKLGQLLGVVRMLLR